MTREEIIRNLKYTMEKHKKNTVVNNTNIPLMCKDILDYLAQEPCPDAISRQAALGCCRNEWEEEVEIRLKSLPPVKVEPCEDAISREQAIKQCGFGMTNLLIADCLRRLPPVKPQPKTGHWIDTDEWRETVDGFEQWGYFRKCSKCGYVFKFLEIDNYCPNCGARMIEPQESEEI